MKKKTPYLDFYCKCLKRRKIIREGSRNTGLCEILGHDKLNIFWPTKRNFNRLIKENMNTTYWGSGCIHEEPRAFTPLRQTIVLFLAAMNNEL